MRTAKEVTDMCEGITNGNMLPFPPGRGMHFAFYCALEWVLGREISPSEVTKLKEDFNRKSYQNCKKQLEKMKKELGEK
jgi:hypothetical protein